MTKEQLAALLNGREYGEEISRDEERQAQAAGLVVVFGYSDDNIEFRGAIQEEIGCYDGGTVELCNGEILSNDCENEDCPHFAKIRKSPDVKKIEAIWSQDGYSWQYKTDIPHASFEIVEDGDKYCRGIVFELAAIK